MFENFRNAGFSCSFFVIFFNALIKQFLHLRDRYLCYTGAGAHETVLNGIIRERIKGFQFAQPECKDILKECLVGTSCNKRERIAGRYAIGILNKEVLAFLLMPEHLIVPAGIGCYFDSPPLFPAIEWFIVVASLSF